MPLFSIVDVENNAQLWAIARIVPLVAKDSAEIGSATLRRPGRFRESLSVSWLPNDIASCKSAGSQFDYWDVEVKRRRKRKVRIQLLWVALVYRQETSLDVMLELAHTSWYSIPRT